MSALGGHSFRSSRTSKEFSEATEIIPGRLYWAAMHETPKSTTQTYYFSTDHNLVYAPFFQDFGPLNLAQVWRYCKLVDSLLRDQVLTRRRLVHHCSEDPRKRSNAALLMGAFQVIVMHKTARQAWEPFEGLCPNLVSFRDASLGPCRFGLSVLDCLEGIETSIAAGWFDWKRFDVESYEFYEKMENGDMNWIIPDRLLAFAGPSTVPEAEPDNYRRLSAEEFASLFSSAGIGLVVRLNKAQYDRNEFIQEGIKHVDLYFRDGSCPPDTIVQQFLHILESQPGPVAVHCKAGLGRTGTLIGLYAMKHHFFPARAFIGWCRICRPGSVLGLQQQYLVDMQEAMFEAGRQFRAETAAQRMPVPLSERLALSQEYFDYEDPNQGERLVHAKCCGRGMASPQSTATVTTVAPETPISVGNSGKALDSCSERSGKDSPSSSSERSCKHGKAKSKDTKKLGQVATAISWGVQKVFRNRTGSSS